MNYKDKNSYTGHKTVNAYRFGNHSETLTFLNSRKVQEQLVNMS
jgi:hypothetical protein